MKNSRSTVNAPAAAPRNSILQPTESPLKISILFDNEASASGGQLLIRRVASDVPCDTESFSFQQLALRARAMAAARSACESDLLVLTVRDDRMLPQHIQSWLGLCLALRDEDQEGALVVLIAKAADTAESKSLLLEYLETVAVIGRLAFFPRQQRAFAEQRCSWNN